MIVESYNQTQLREVLQTIGVKIVSETSTDFLCLCPFHSNKKTPSFAISYSKGLYVCYNPSCDAKGNLKHLIQRVGSMSEGEANRMLLSIDKMKIEHFDEDLAKLLEVQPDFEEFSQEILDTLHDNLMSSQKAVEYFDSRNINLNSIEYFSLGYSENQNMVTVPVHSPNGQPVGLVGRSIEGKSFKNSTNLPRSKTMFNIHRAKKFGSKIIVTESCFDAIRVHQAGFPNVVATLGGHISKENLANLNKYASTIIIATDSDEAGRRLGNQIATTLKWKEILWANYNDSVVYPHDAKDMGDLTDEEIKICIKNAKHHFEYISL
jgi:DNA primase